MNRGKYVLNNGDNCVVSLQGNRDLNYDCPEILNEVIFRLKSYSTRNRFAGEILVRMIHSFNHPLFSLCVLRCLFICCGCGYCVHAFAAFSLYQYI